MDFKVVLGVYGFVCFLADNADECVNDFWVKHGTRIAYYYFHGIFLRICPPVWPVGNQRLEDIG